MRIKARGPLVFLGLLSAASLLAQDSPLPSGSISIKFPNDSPVLQSSTITNQSRTQARGAAMVIDLDVLLLLRNVGRSEIRGLTLRVVAQEVTLGGKGSMTYPSLHVAPGETFPVSIAMQLVRPTQIATGPLVEVSLDGVLYRDLGFYGPDRLNSRRTLVAYEMEAQRDRGYLKRILEQRGAEGLRAAVMDVMQRQVDRPRLDARVLRGPAMTSAAVSAPQTAAKFAFLQFPDSPVSPLSGWAQIAGNEVRAPRVEVKNTSSSPVKYVELGWLVSDRTGRQYMAASLPASDPELYLPPGKTASVLGDTALRFSRQGQPVNVQRMTGFVSMVEFASGKVWVPNHQNLENADLLRVLAPSAEEERLTDLYRKKGLNAVIDELQKY